MRALVAGLLLVLAGAAFGQVSDVPPFVGRKGATLPTNCQIGEVFFKTDATAGQNLYMCTAANTWTQQLNSGGTADLTNAFYHNQGTTAQVLHGNASGNLSWSAVAIGSDVSGLGTGVATALAVNTGSSGAFARLIASGAKALATSSISSGACSSAQTDTATGTLTTDVISVTFSADPTATTGYSASSSGGLHIISYPTADTVNFKVCNNTAGSITPGAVTLNWRVVR